MEEVHHETVLDYLRSLQGLGPQDFLAAYKHPYLVENYLAPSSRTNLARVETISEMDREDLISSDEKSADVFPARVIAVEKRDKDSSERMIFVGRSGDNDIVLLNKMVSKLHAYFSRVPGSQIVQLVDMHSTNGTFVNDAKISPSVKTRLEDNDVISFGPETRFEFFTPVAFCQLLQHHLKDF
jgi:hypothetical protein